MCIGLLILLLIPVTAQDCNDSAAPCTGTCYGEWCNGSGWINDSFYAGEKIDTGVWSEEGVSSFQTHSIFFNEISYYKSNLRGIQLIINTTDVGFKSGYLNSNLSVTCLIEEIGSSNNNFTSSVGYTRYESAVYDFIVIKINNMRDFSAGFDALTGRKYFYINTTASPLCSMSSLGITSITNERYHPSGSQDDCDNSIVINSLNRSSDNAVIGFGFRAFDTSSYYCNIVKTIYHVGSTTITGVDITYSAFFSNYYEYNITIIDSSYLDIQKTISGNCYQSLWNVEDEIGINPDSSYSCVNRSISSISEWYCFDVNYYAFWNNDTCVGYYTPAYDVVEPEGVPTGWSGVYIPGNPFINVTKDWIYDSDQIPVEYELTDLAIYAYEGSGGIAQDFGVWLAGMGAPPVWWIEFDLINNTTYQTDADAIGGPWMLGPGPSDGLLVAAGQPRPPGYYRAELWGSFNLIDGVSLVMEGVYLGNAQIFGVDFFNIRSSNNTLYWTTGDSGNICEDLVLSGYAANLSTLNVTAPNTTLYIDNSSFQDEIIQIVIPLNMSDVDSSGVWTAILTDSNGSRLLRRVVVTGDPITSNSVTVKPKKVYLGESVLIETKSTQAGWVRWFDATGYFVDERPMSKCLSERYYNISVNETQRFFDAGTWTARIYHVFAGGEIEVDNTTFTVSYGDRPSAEALEKDQIQRLDTFVESSLGLHGESGKMLVVLLITSIACIGVLAYGGGASLGILTAGMSIGFFTIIGFVGAWLMMLVVLALLALAVPNTIRMLTGG